MMTVIHVLVLPEFNVDKTTATVVETETKVSVYVIGYRNEQQESLLTFDNSLAAMKRVKKHEIRMFVKNS